MARRDVERQAKGNSTPASFLVALYTAAELKISGWVQRVIGRDASNRDLLQAQHAVLAELGTLKRETPDMARRLIESAFDTGNGEASHIIGDRHSGRYLSAINSDAVTVLLDNLIEGLDGATRTVGRRVDDIFRREGLRAALQTIEHNQPEGVASDAMARRIAREGITGFVDKRGRRWKLSTYARMATRTTASEAVSHGVARKMIEQGYDLVKVSDHDCKFHPGDPANPCVALEGKTVSLTGLTDGFPFLEAMPPFHPNCTHYILPSPQAFEANPTPPELVVA